MAKQRKPARKNSYKISKLPIFLTKITSSRKLLALAILAVVLLGIGGGYGVHQLVSDSKSPATQPVKGDSNHDGKVNQTDKLESANQQASDQANQKPVAKPANSTPQIYDMRLDNRYLHDFPGEVFGISIPKGDSQVTVPFEVYSTGINISGCTLNEHVVHDFPNDQAEDIKLKSVALQNVTLYDGYNTLTVNCAVGSQTITRTMKVPLTDGLPEACRNFNFSDSAVSVSSYEELKNGVVGTWQGCVTTPWIPKYFVTVTFRSDGTYSATSDEVLDFVPMTAMYYGSNLDNPNKTYAVKNLNGDMTGDGEINITWDATSSQTSRGGLRNVKLMGSKLSFEFFHFNQYGPVTFQLYRQ
jgi:hypothetical protein